MDEERAVLKVKALGVLHKSLDGKETFIPALQNTIAITVNSGDTFVLIKEKHSKNLVNKVNVTSVKNNNDLVVTLDGIKEITFIDFFNESHANKNTLILPDNIQEVFYLKSDFTFEENESSDSSTYIHTFYSEDLIDKQDNTTRGNAHSSPIKANKSEDDDKAEQIGAWSKYLILGGATGLGIIGVATFDNGGNANAIEKNVPTISGTVMAGPLLPNHGIHVGFFSLGNEASVFWVVPDEWGHYSVDAKLIDAGIYIAKTLDTTDKADYLDEATGRPSDLEKELKAIVIIEDGDKSLIVNLNLLTTIAADAILLDGGVPSITRDKVAAINQGIAHHFGFEESDINQVAVRPVINADGSLREDANSIGKVIAAISGAEKMSGSTHITDTLSKDMASSDAGLSEDGIKQLIGGAVVVGERLGIDLASDIMGLLTSENSTPMVTIDEASSMLESLSAQSLLARNFTGIISSMGDGHQVVVLVSDGVTNVEPEVNIKGNYWSTEPVDMSIFNEGQISVSAKVLGQEGAVLSQQLMTYAHKMQIPVIGIDPFTDDDVINALELPAFIVSGSTQYVVDNTLLKISLTDGEDNSAVTQAVVEGNAFETTTTDISHFVSGTVNVLIAADLSRGGSASESVTFTLDGTLPVLGFDYQFKNNNPINGEKARDFMATGVIDHTGDVSSVTVSIADGDDIVNTQATVTGNTWISESVDIQSLRDGDIAISIKATDNNGNAAEEVTYSLIKDTQAPSVAMNIIGENNAINKKMTSGFTIDGSFSDSMENTSIVLAITSGSQTQLQTAQITENQWHIDITGIDKFTDGEVTVAVEAIDAFGNRSSQVTQVLDWDIHEPKISVNTKAGNRIGLDDLNNWVIEGTIDDIEDGQILNIALTDDVKSITSTAVVMDNQWMSEALDMTVFSKDAVKAVFTIVDRANNPADELVIVYQLDEEPPSIAINDFDSQTINKIQSSSLTVTGTTSGVENNQPVDIRITDGAYTIYASVDVQDNQWSVADLDLQNLNHGDITFTVRVEDLAGNNSPVESKTIYLDNIVPSILVSSTQYPDKKINSDEAKSFTVFVSVRNVETDQTITLSITDSEGVKQGASSTVSDSLWAVLTADISALASGAITTAISVSDVSNNTTTVSEVFTLDVDNPVIAFDALTAVDNVINAAEINSVKLTGRSEGLEDNQIINLSVTDGLSEKDFQAVVANDIWMADNLDFTDFIEGDLHLSIEAEDSAGNSSVSVAKTIQIDLSEIPFSLSDNSSVQLINALSLTDKVYYVLDKNDDGIIDENDKVDYGLLKNMLNEGMDIADTQSNNHDGSDDSRSVLITSENTDYALILPTADEIGHVDTSFLQQSIPQWPSESIWIASVKPYENSSMDIATMSIHDDSFAMQNYSVFEVVIV